MIRLVSKATLLSTLGVLAASYALAGVPNLTNSTIGIAGRPNNGGFTVVMCGYNGTTFGTVANGSGNFEQHTITVRDAANNAVASSVVVLNFNACAPPPGGGPANGIKLSTNQFGSGMTLNTGARSMSGVTNSLGAVIFRVSGGSFNSVGNAADPANCISVTADGVPLGTLSGATFDQNGVGNITGADAGLFQNDLFGAYRHRSDYNKDGLVSGADGALMNNQLFGSFGGTQGGGAGGSVGPYIP